MYSTMKQAMQQVDWKSYASTYDMLMQYNPFYQKLHSEVMEHVGEWKMPGDALIADLGAGTGNYSLSLAQLFPQAQILHIDNNEGMNARVIEKREALGIENHKVLDVSVNALTIQPETLDGLVSIHAFYAFPNPQEVMKQSATWLRPGGRVMFVDAGRIVNVLKWQLAIGYRLIRQYGLKKSMELFSQAKEISAQNAYIREMQRDGTYWTHSHEEFLEAVRDAGFAILDSKKVFRGVSDLVVAIKP